MKKFDAIIIGFGKGGKTLAGKLAGSGKSVALVEKSDRMYGGTCINVGCIPSKSLVRSAGLSKLRTEADFEEKAALYRAAIAEKRRLTAMLREKNYQKLAGNPNAAVIHGAARFLSPYTVAVDTAQGTLELAGEQIFINTGATPFIPPIEGLRDNPFVYTSETLMELEVLPRELVIIGGGYIGLEFASMYRNFGAGVTILQDIDTFLPREDRDMAQEIKRALEARGIRILLGAAIHRVGGGQRAEVAFSHAGEEHVLRADAVLSATGRRPNVQGLGCEKAGVELTPRGAVWVDEKLRTSVPHIYAMGDVTGGLQFTYVSLDDYRVVASQLSGGSYTTAGRSHVPNSVFIDPPFSRVGLSEAEARAAGKNIRVAKLPAAAIPKAQVLRNPVGLLKAVVDADTGGILGAMLFCEESYEMINIVKLAMDLGADYTVLRDQIYTHPTMSEALGDLFSAL